MDRWAEELIRGEDKLDQQREDGITAKTHGQDLLTKLDSLNPDRGSNGPSFINALNGISQFMLPGSNPFNLNRVKKLIEEGLLPEALDEIKDTELRAQINDAATKLAEQKFGPLGTESSRKVIAFLSWLILSAGVFALTGINPLSEGKFAQAALLFGTGAGALSSVREKQRDIEQASKEYGTLANHQFNIQDPNGTSPAAINPTSSTTN